MDEIKYKDLFKKISKERFKREVDFNTIEQGVAHLRVGDILTYNDLGMMSNDNCWEFKDFWMWPTKEQIDEKLQSSQIKLINLPDNQLEVISKLLDVFKNLSLASIVLRFVWPEHYAIYSRPPLKVINPERGIDDLKEYENYLNALTRYKYTFRVERIADLDMIFWAFAHLGKDDPLLTEFNKTLPKYISTDIIIGNKNKPLKVAKIFRKNNDNITAGFWAANAFEKWIQEKCNLYGIHPRDPKKYEHAIEATCKNEAKYRHKKDMLYKTRNLRVKALKETDKFTPNDAEKLIENVGKINNL